MHSEPSGSRLTGKCRSSKQISEPSSTSGSTAPHTVTASTASTPISASAAMFARCVTWLESRTWPTPWRETCATSTPANVPRDTSASPQRVATGSGSPASNPGSAYVPEPVMMPIAIGAGCYGTYGGASPQPQCGTGASGGGVAPGCEFASAIRVPHSM